MKTVKHVLSALLMAASIFAIIECGLFFCDTRKVVQELPGIAERQIQEQGNKTRGALAIIITDQSAQLQKLIATQLANTRSLVSSELDRTRGSLTVLVSAEMDKTRGSLSSATDTLDNRLEVIQRDLNGQILTAGSNLNDRIKDFHVTLETSLRPINAITSQAAGVAPLFLDCDHNADCLFNRWVGVGRGIEQTSESVGKISTDFSILIHKLTEKKPWYKKLPDYFKLGVYGAELAIK
jgi:hypothetical protein